MRRFFLVVVACAFIACATESRAQEPERQLHDEEDEEIDQQAHPLEPAQKVEPSQRSPQSSVSSDSSDEESARALERALVLQGGSVIPPKAFEMVPEITYFYSEPGGVRRDTVRSAMTLRLGLPWSSQLNVRVPYTVYDSFAGVSSSSGLGDIDVGLTQQLIAERAFVPELLISARWKTTTGRTETNPPTGNGVDTVQGALTAVKRQDPLVFFGSVAYTASLGSGPFDVGDFAGGQFGVFLAATPDTSLLFDIDVNSTFTNRFDEFGRLFGVAEVGFLTVLSRKTVLNINAGFGFTPAAPDFRLTISLPIRF
jgi:hypothetical protein